MDSAQLYRKIGDFLAEHGLWPTPDNYALIHALFANTASPAAEAVKAATADGLRLSQRDADRIKSEVGIEPSAPPRPGGGVDPAVLAAATQRVEEFVAIVEAQRADAQSYGADLAAGADRLEAAGDPGSIGALVAVTRAMVERTRKAEAQLTAARDETQKLRVKLAEVGEEARSDPLTRLPNRRAFEEQLKVFEDKGTKLSLAICDIDHFKRINDRYGHPVGDRVLRVVADTLRDNCGGHMVARLGGEEFVVLFEGLPPTEGARILDEARELLAARHFKVRETDAPLGKITFSAGIACARRKADQPAIARADALLYEAKNAGRNQVRFEAA
ncbi:MAG: GGDEF domain-containing protein [Sphingomonadaceae bacterium]|nr:GGDEF domain-containing protein [Sphingomonadaceae bacterium]